MDDETYISRRLFRSQLGKASVISSSRQSDLKEGATYVSKRRKLTIRNVEIDENEHADNFRSGREAPRHRGVVKSAVALIGAAVVAAALQYGASG